MWQPELTKAAIMRRKGVPVSRHLREFTQMKKGLRQTDKAHIPMVNVPLG